ncbi:MAG TPA: hypothetical protein VLH35_00120 [Candidatus Acidoferrales bacterium]|nr:hypothetical protein [Candidatus Acidoferrales bacterium]
MGANSFNDILSMINTEALPFIIDRLDDEGFDHVGELTIWCKKNFREILHDYFTKKIDLKFATVRCCSEINPPPNLRQTAGWQLRMLKGEISKIFTLGYGDYLLSLGETECYVPYNNYDQNPDCQRLIVGKRHKIRDIQENMYKNYGLRAAVYPTVPLHVDCLHIITRIPDKS